MYSQRNRKNGFTLVEILVVIAIFGVFMGAVYSLYIAQYKTATSREDVVDVQQNVRIAMDRVTRDLRMAGFMYPAPVEKAFSNHSTIKIQTASADVTFVSINSLIHDGRFGVTPPTVLSNIKSNKDTICIFRPSTREQVPPTGVVFSVLSSSSSNGIMSISPATSATLETLRIGDLICKNPDRIDYRVDRTDTTQGCDKSPCLKRNSEVIAQGINNIRFDYFFEGVNDDPKIDLSPASVDITKITAIRVTVIGKTVRNSSSEDSIKTRELKSLIKLRNYK